MSSKTKEKFWNIRSILLDTFKNTNKTWSTNYNWLPIEQLQWQEAFVSHWHGVCISTCFFRQRCCMPVLSCPSFVSNRTKWEQDVTTGMRKSLCMSTDTRSMQAHTANHSMRQESSSTQPVLLSLLWRICRCQPPKKQNSGTLPRNDRTHIIIYNIVSMDTYYWYPVNIL